LESPRGAGCIQARERNANKFRYAALCSGQHVALVACTHFAVFGRRDVAGEHLDHVYPTRHDWQEDAIIVSTKTDTIQSVLKGDVELLVECVREATKAERFWIATNPGTAKEPDLTAQVCAPFAC
jgi:hypothetical protein